MAKQVNTNNFSGKVGFVVPLNNKSKSVGGAIDQLQALIAKSKYSAKLVLVDNASTDGTADAVESNKNFKSLAQQDKAALVKVQSKSGANVYMGQASEHIDDCDWVVVLDVDMPFNISSFNQWFGSKASNLNNKAVYVGSRVAANKDKKNKKPSGNILYNVFRSLLTPLKVQGTDAGFFLMSKTAFSEISGNVFTKGAKLNIEFPHKASLLGYSVREFPLSSKEGQKFNVGALAVITSAIKTRIDWFVKIPISKSFGPKKSEEKISSGSHPFWRLTFFTLTILTLFILPTLSFDYGITWDEPDDKRYFETVYDYFATGGENKACLDTSVNAPNTNKHLIHYGTFVNLTCEVVDRHLSPFGVYETRHLVIAIFSFIGIFFTGLIGRRVGNWRLAVLAFLFLLLTPVYFGNGMNNHKDIPFAAFYMASIYFMIQFLTQLPKPRFGTMFFLGLCMGIIMSIRVPGVVVFAYFGLFVGVYWLLYLRKNKMAKASKLIPRYAKYVLLTLGWAYFVGVILWPYALQDPINHPLESFKKFSEFQFVHIWDVFEGSRKYMKDYIWYFIPKYILLTTPIFILGGIALGVITYIKLKHMFNVRLINIMWFTALFPILYAIYNETNLYNSWRQMLFAFPPLVVVAATGWEWMLQNFKAKGVKIAVAAALTVLVLKPTVWMVQNHPYQYLYYNEIAGGVQGAYGYYELDYWCQTPREAIVWIMENEDLSEDRRYTVISNNKNTSSQYYADKIDSGKIYIDWARDQELHQKPWDYAILTTRLFGQKQLLGNSDSYPPGDSAWFPPKGTLHTIDVDGVPVCAIVKNENKAMFEGWRCMEQKKFDSAIYFYKEAIKYNPLDEEAHRNLGFTYLQMNNVNDAEGPLKTAISLRAENFKALYYIAFVARAKGDNQKAINYLQESIKHKANNSGAYKLLGDIYMQSQRFDLAEENYMSAYMYGGPNQQVLQSLAVCYYYLRRYGESLAYAEAVIRLNQNFPNAYAVAANAAKALNDQQRVQQYSQAFQQLTGQGVPPM